MLHISLKEREREEHVSAVRGAGRLDPIHLTSMKALSCYLLAKASAEGEKKRGKKGGRGRGGGGRASEESRQRGGQQVYCFVRGLYHSGALMCIEREEKAQRAIPLGKKIERFAAIVFGA